MKGIRCYFFGHKWDETNYCARCNHPFWGKEYAVVHTEAIDSVMTERNRLEARIAQLEDALKRISTAHICEGPGCAYGGLDWCIRVAKEGLVK